MKKAELIERLSFVSSIITIVFAAKDLFIQDKKIQILDIITNPFFAFFIISILIYVIAGLYFKLALLHELIQLKQEDHNHALKLITNRLHENGIPFSLKDTEIEFHEEISEKRSARIEEIEKKFL